MSWIDKAKGPKEPEAEPEITLEQAFDVMMKHGIRVTSVSMQNDVHSYKTLGMAMEQSVVTGQQLTFSMEAYPASKEIHSLLNYMHQKAKGGFY